MSLPEGLTRIEPAQVTLVVRVACLIKEADLGPLEVKLNGLGMVCRLSCSRLK